MGCITWKGPCLSLCHTGATHPPSFKATNTPTHKQFCLLVKRPVIWIFLILLKLKKKSVSHQNKEGMTPTQAIRDLFVWHCSNRYHCRGFIMWCLQAFPFLLLTWKNILDNCNYFGFPLLNFVVRNSLLVGEKNLGHYLCETHPNKQSRGRRKTFTSDFGRFYFHRASRNTAWSCDKMLCL